MYLLPPKKGFCQYCGVDHPPEQPHDAVSLFYQLWFMKTYRREATWADAMAHCSDEVKRSWTEQLENLGIDINSSNVTGGIRTAQDLEQRLRLTENPLTTLKRKLNS